MKPIILLQKHWARLDYWAALGFGSGLSPWLPGTCGTLFGLIVFLLSPRMALGWGLLVCGLAFLLGCWLCDTTARALGEGDPSAIVWDEIVGIWCVLLMVPYQWEWQLLAFALFRLFDMVKPFPIGWFDRHLKGGFGIMLDDIVAAAMSGLCLLLAQHGHLIIATL